MSFDIRLPNLTAATPDAKLQQMHSYMYQLVQELNWALNTIETGSSSQSVTNAPGNTVVSDKDKDAQASFNDIKALIIKSADIVTAYYEEMKERFDGQYVAESDFGTYAETTSAEINKTSTSVNELYTNLQQIITDIDNLEHRLIDVNAYINSGLLYYDDAGVPIYGLEVGQRNVLDGVEVFNKYARFISNRLSFYDENDTEVAYVSDYKLYITNAEITGSLKLGRYVIDTSDGLIIKWV